MIDLSEGHWTSFLMLILILTLAIFLRYIIMAGIFHYVFNHGEFLPHRRLSTKPIQRKQIRREIWYSFLSSFIFSLLGTLLYWSWQTGRLTFGININPVNLLWIISGLLLLLLAHETYYYWLHRWMHRPGIYRYIHKAHHESLNTTAWTSFSFHPIESFLQALPLFALLYFIPFHIISVILALVIMAITSVINHLNIEIYSDRFIHHWLGKWWIGATHHHLHHVQFNFNFGLYFTFWDHWMKTESPDFQKMVSEKLKS